MAHLPTLFERKGAKIQRKSGGVRPAHLPMLWRRSCGVVVPSSSKRPGWSRLHGGGSAMAMATAMAMVHTLVVYVFCIYNLFLFSSRPARGRGAGLSSQEPFL